MMFHNEFYSANHRVIIDNEFQWISVWAMRLIVGDIHRQCPVDEERELVHEEKLIHVNTMEKSMEKNRLNIVRITKSKQRPVRDQ